MSPPRAGPPVAETSGRRPGPPDGPLDGPLDGAASSPPAGPGVDRAAAFAAGPPRFPRKVIVLAAAAFVVLGLGGVVLDRLFPGPVGATTSTTTGVYPPPLSTGPVTAPAPAPVATAGAQLPARAAALMGLQGLSGAPAPPFRLVDQLGRPSSPGSFRGKVVVVSFFDATCNDICPVLETELAEAYRDLGGRGARVEFVTVDTDPLALAPAAARPAEEGVMASVPGWRFLTGSLAQLDAVWARYGVSVQVQRSTKAVSHNDVLYFIDPAGRGRARATPFADESFSGSFSLNRATEARWAAGIASEARALDEARPMTPTRAAPVIPVPAPAPKKPFYQRRAFLVPGVLTVVLAVVVLTDLPQDSSRSAQITNDTTVMSEVNADIGPCSYALSESLTIYRDLASRSLTKAEQRQVPGLLTDDQAACSFTDDSIYQLSTITVPGSGSGRDLGQLVGTVTLWATDDALSAIEQVQLLDSDLSNRHALKVLAGDEKLLASDRAQAEAELAAADKAVQRRLPALDLAQAPASAG